MYFTNINDAELSLFHKTVQNNLNITLPYVLTSPMFKIEEIIENKLYKVYPLFYCEKIVSSNSNDKILDNKCIICEKNIGTVFSFQTSHINAGTIELGYSIYYDFYGVCVFCYDKLSGNPVNNVEIDGITNRNEKFNGFTDNRGLWTSLFIGETKYFLKFELKYENQTLDVKA